MSDIYNSKKINIHKKNGQYEIVIQDHKFIHSYIGSILNGLNIISDTTVDNKRTIKIKAHSIETLPKLLKMKKDKLSYLHLKNMFIDISEQIKSLKNDDKGILFFDIKDIIIINNDDVRYDSKFIFINMEKFINLNHHNDFDIITPFKTKKKTKHFYSPELLKIKKIPSNVPYNSCYYSFGLFISFCLQPFKKDCEYNIECIKKHLESISKSKVYWAILRTLQKNPNDRYLLFI
tara:strand:+ start:97 stop:798 length:702 start_codon:yes stop_codon:yes gene_type:complete